MQNGRRCGSALRSTVVTTPLEGGVDIDAKKPTLLVSLQQSGLSLRRSRILPEGNGPSFKALRGKFRRMSEKILDARGLADAAAQTLALLKSKTQIRARIGR